jgi:predicted Rossmann-fold nucleotide-binding protein
MSAPEDVSQRVSLYDTADLFDGFDESAPGSYANTFDARMYLSSVSNRSEHDRMARSLHDHHITEARDRFLAEQRQVGRSTIAVMGGHAEQRGSAVYRSVAHMAWHLAATHNVASGGGPGAMEATHLGAMVADRHALDTCIDHLCEQAAAFPSGMKHLVSDGRFSAELVGQLHEWQTPAFQVLGKVGRDQRRTSLSIPTWFYGHEPPTPFATHTAKYFHNALREDGLLAIADAGIIYAPGKAGTVQEIFQDAAQNYYESFGRFSPMAFLDIDGYWSTKFPVSELLRPLFGDERMQRSVLISNDADHLVEWITSGQHV